MAVKSNNVTIKKKCLIHQVGFLGLSIKYFKDGLKSTTQNLAKGPNFFYRYS